MKKIIIPFIFASALCFTIIAQEDTLETNVDPESPFYEEQDIPVSKKADITKSYTITLEHFSLGLEESAKMLRQNLDNADTYKFLIEKAKIEELAVLTSSEKMISSLSVKEHIYPTEYQPPAKDSINLTKVQTIPITPDSFETRNIGFSVDAKLTLLDNGNHHLSCMSEFVAHIGDSEHGEEPVKVTMPIFTTLSLNYHSIIKLATPTVLGTMSPLKKSEEDSINKRIWFVVGTVREVK